MNQTQKQIDNYTRLINPKPMEKKPETATRKDLETDYNEVPAGLESTHQNLLKQAEEAAEVA